MENRELGKKWGAHGSRERDAEVSHATHYERGDA